MDWKTNRAARYRGGGTYQAVIDFGLEDPRRDQRIAVQSFGARGVVIVGLANGKQFLVGTDEPDRLVDTIIHALGREPVFAGIRGAGTVAE